MIKILKNWTDKLNLLRQPWWIEVLTTQPKCTYYFGPFINATEANLAVVGYVEDLEGESAQGIQTIVKRCKPVELTIEDDL
jgi:Domain of unknown function (DUF1816)